MSIFTRKESGQGLAYKLPQADLLFAMDSVTEDVKTDCSRMTGRTCISSDAFDRDGDIVEQDGFIWDNYKNNPVVFFNHQQFPLPIGRSEDDEGKLTIERAGSKTYATCYFCQKDKLSNQIFHLVDDKVIRAASIAFNIRHATPLASEPAFANNKLITKAPRFRIHKSEVTEWSWVGIGANPEAVASYLGKGFIAGSAIDEPLRKALEPYSAKLEGLVAVPDLAKIAPPPNREQKEPETDTSEPQSGPDQSASPHQQKVQALLDQIGQRSATQDHVKQLLEELSQLPDDAIVALGQSAKIEGMTKPEILSNLEKLLQSQLEASLKTDDPPAPKPEGQDGGKRPSFHSVGSNLREKLNFGKRFEAWQAMKKQTKAMEVQTNAYPLVNPATPAKPKKKKGHGIYKCKKCSKIVKQCRCPAFLHPNGKKTIYKVVCEECKGKKGEKVVAIKDTIRKHYGPIASQTALNHALSAIYANSAEYGIDEVDRETIYAAVAGIRQAVDGMIEPSLKKWWFNLAPDTKIYVLQFLIDDAPPASKPEVYAQKFAAFLPELMAKSKDAPTRPEPDAV